MSTISLGQERIANILKQEKRSFVISFSGGCDSTTILDILCKEIEKNSLKDECNIFLTYHSIHSFRFPGVLVLERHSISDIMSIYKNQGFHIYDINLDSKLDEIYTADPTLKYGSYLALPVLWVLAIASTLLIVPPSKIQIFMGYIKDDDAIRCKKEILDIYSNIFKIYGIKDTNIDFPLENTSKEDIILYLQKNKLYDKVTFCEASDNCNVQLRGIHAIPKCKCCERHLNALLHIEIMKNKSSDTSPDR
jgi:7-cyano-7-deazaguanine synthase in queuosine biosynthesis